MAIYNAERYIAEFIRSIIEDGLDEGQDVCHLSDQSFIDENNDVITRPTLEELKTVDKSLVAAMLANYMYDVYCSSHEEYVKLKEERMLREKEERERLEKSPRFIRGKNAGCNGQSPTDATDDYLKGYFEGRKEFLEKQ